MFYCFNEISNTFKEEIEYAKSIDRYIYYNEMKDIFLDKAGNEIDITNLLIFPRSKIQRSRKLIASIIKKKGISIMEEYDFDKTLNWPYYINTKRRNMIISGRQIIAKNELITDIFDKGQILFKTKEKNFSRIIDISLITGGDLIYSKTIEEHQDDDFIISEPIDIIKDEFGPLEYRTFIVNQEILNISRISKTLSPSIPKEVIDKIIETKESLKETDFPKSYVIDIVIYLDKDGKKVIDVLECNPVIASATFPYNSIFGKSKNLEYPNIPQEKTSNNIQTRNNPRSSILYTFPYGFAKDLILYSMYDTKTSAKKLSRIK